MASAVPSRQKDVAHFVVLATTAQPPGILDEAVGDKTTRGAPSPVISIGARYNSMYRGGKIPVYPCIKPFFRGSSEDTWRMIP